MSPLPTGLNTAEENAGPPEVAGLKRQSSHVGGLPGLVSPTTRPDGCGQPDKHHLGACQGEAISSLAQPTFKNEQGIRISFSHVPWDPRGGPKLTPPGRL